MFTVGWREYPPYTIFETPSHGKHAGDVGYDFIDPYTLHEMCIVYTRHNDVDFRQICWRHPLLHATISRVKYFFSCTHSQHLYVILRCAEKIPFLSTRNSLFWTYYVVNLPFRFGSRLDCFQCRDDRFPLCFAVFIHRRSFFCSVRHISARLSSFSVIWKHTKILITCQYIVQFQNLRKRYYVLFLIPVFNVQVTKLIQFT
jgi:hypothetical protein